MSTPEQVMTAEKLNDLRRRVLSNDELTREELKSAVFALVGERIANAQATVTASKKRPSRSVNLDDLLGEPKKDINLDDLAS